MVAAVCGGSGVVVAVEGCGTCCGDRGAGPWPAHDEPQPGGTKSWPIVYAGAVRAWCPWHAGNHARTCAVVVMAHAWME